MTAVTYMLRCSRTKRRINCAQNKNTIIYKYLHCTIMHHHNLLNNYSTIYICIIKIHLFEDDGYFCAVSSSRFSFPSDAPEYFVPSDDAPLMQYDLGQGIKTSCDSNCGKRT